MTFEDVEDLQSIKELFEEQYDCLVYYSILTETATMGQMVSFFYVSRNEEEWEDDVRELREGFPFVYVWNRDLGIGEFGSIQFEMVEGAVVRIA